MKRNKTVYYKIHLYPRQLISLLNQLDGEHIPLNVFLQLDLLLEHITKKSYNKVPQKIIDEGFPEIIEGIDGMSFNFWFKKKADSIEKIDRLEVIRILVQNAFDYRKDLLDLIEKSCKMDLKAIEELKENKLYQE